MLLEMSCSNQTKDTSVATDSSIYGEDTEIVTVPESSEEEYPIGEVDDYDGSIGEEYVTPTYNAPTQPIDDNTVHSLDEYDGN